MVKHKNGLPREAVGHTPFEIVKIPPDQQSALVDPAWRRGLDWVVSRSAFKPQLCCDSGKGKLAKQGHRQKMLLPEFGSRLWRDRVVIRKEKSFLPFFPVPPTPTHAFCASTEGGREGEGDPSARASELSDLERAGEKEDPLPALGHTPGRLTRPLANWHFSDPPCSRRG